MGFGVNVDTCRQVVKDLHELIVHIRVYKKQEFAITHSLLTERERIHKVDS